MSITKERYTGQVLHWTYSGNGFIYDYKKKCKVYVHFTDVNCSGFQQLAKGWIVSYKLTYNVDRQTWVAKNVKILNGDQK
jgi:cold shock CspA family protein